MEISSNTLFHFTNHYEYFIDSLKHGLWPRYNIEHCWNGKNFAIPMVCFCDIPLSQIQNHVNRYGKYGIGVTKEFAKRNDITPVLYVDASSKLKQKIDTLLTDYTLPTTDENNIQFSEIMLYYLKRVEGIETKEDQNGKKKQVHVKYYNEREWRYIPSISNAIHLEIDGKTTLKSCKELCEQTKKNNRLLLEPNDIQYLIVRCESMVLRLYEEIDEIYHSFPPNEKKLLKTKIICIQQIKKDF